MNASGASHPGIEKVTTAKCDNWWVSQKYA